MRVRVVKIDESKRVPLFEALERPSNWIRNLGGADWDEIGQFRRALWNHVAQRHSAVVSPGWASSNVHHQVGDVYISLYVLASGQVGAFLGVPKSKGERGNGP